MYIEIHGPTTAEGDCKQSKKMEVEPYFFSNTRSQVVQRIVVKGAAGAEAKYVLRVTGNGKLTLVSDVTDKKVIPRFDKVVPPEVKDGNSAGN